MSVSPLGNILKRLQNHDLILPHLETSMLAEAWPDSYQVTVDSSPYYGINPDGTPDGFFHPSSMPLLGARQLYYMFHPDTRDKMIPRKRDMTGHFTLAIHSAMHAMLQEQLKMAGLCGPEDIEVEFRDEVHWVRGRADAVAHLPDGSVYPVEIKGMNPRSFSRLEKIKPEWDAQVSIGCDNLGYDTAVIIVVEMGYPWRMREFLVPRNDVLLSSVYQKFDYVRSCIALNTPPRHCCAIDSPEAGECPARKVCWQKEE